MKWRFPENATGSVKGLNDQVETFMKNPLGSLAKEICQNSLDEIQDLEQPVEIHFQTFDMPTKDYLEGIPETLQQEFKYWDQRQEHDKKVPNFYQHALDLISKETVRCLRISDFNTTGLTGSKETDTGKWNHLIKSTGVSDKKGGQLGSFGLGKFAPFANSSFRMVFYSTKDTEGLEATQGVARLSSFREDSGRLRDGLGYYCADEDYSAINKWLSLDSEYTRTSAGTDVFIVAFNGGEDWIDQLIQSLLDNFIFSFLWNKLIVSINGKLINNSNIHTIIDEAKSKEKIDPLTCDYYESLMGADKHHFMKTIFQKNDVELVMKLKKGLGRKVAIVRNNGMKIFDKDRISARAQFAGVLTLSGEKVNSYFKRLEDPTHSAWDLSRAPNPKDAENKQKQIYGFINQCFNSLIDKERPDTMDAIGAGEFLPDFGDLNSDKQPAESLTDRIIKDLEVKRSKPRNPNRADTQEDNDDGTNIDTGELGSADPDGNVLVDKPGDLGTGGSGTHDIGSDTEKGSKDDDGDRHVLEKSKIHDIDVKFRVVRFGSGLRINIIPKFDISVGELELFSSGENVKDPINVLSAKSDKSKLKVLKQNGVEVTNLKRDVANFVYVELEREFGYAVEVSLYEIKQK